VRDLHTKALAVAQLSSSKDVIDTIDAHFHGMVDELSQDASTYLISAFPTVGRDRVSTYRNLLWLWHRLEAPRWAMSQVQLRIGKTAPQWDVDHAVAYSLWEDKIAILDSEDERQEELAQATRLGNCLLLEKNFNISKSKKELTSFLETIHEFASGQLSVDGWAKALDIPAEIMSPADKDVQILKNAIEQRDQRMRAELVEFARGKRIRSDIETEISLQAAVGN
jgi:hypothetical protein